MTTELDKSEVAARLRQLLALFDRDPGPVALQDVIDVADALGGVARVDGRGVLWIETRWNAPQIS